MSKAFVAYGPGYSGDYDTVSEAANVVAAHDHKGHVYERVDAAQSRRIAELEAALRKAERELRDWRGAMDPSEWGGERGVAMRQTDLAIGFCEDVTRDGTAALDAMLERAVHAGMDNMDEGGMAVSLDIAAIVKRVKEGR